MKKIKYFEMFAGIGAQSIALEKVNKNKFEYFGMSEWDAYAIISYFHIHGYEFGSISLPSDSDIIGYLSNRDYSLDGKDIAKSIQSKPIKFLRELYEADIVLNNTPNVENIENDFFNVNNIDLLTYSFPCQDLSSAGKEAGIERNSGTRSGLLWKVEEILYNTSSINRPTFLLMENVKNLISKKHIVNFEDFLSSLEKMGYINHYGVLNARDFGIPQNRERVFCLSIKKDFLYSNKSKHDELYTLLLDKSNNLCTFTDKYKVPMEELSNYLKIDYKNEKYLSEARWAVLNPTPSRLRMWNSEKRLLNYNNKKGYNFDDLKKPLFTKTITTKQDRWGNSGMLAFKESKSGRPLTPRETLLLMGFKEKHYDRIPTDLQNSSNSNTILSLRKIYHQSGNSIVVNCLVAIFNVIDEL